MNKFEELVFKASKEIIVKFIETGRVSPTGFHETFKSIYNTIEETVKGSEASSEQDRE